MIRVTVTDEAGVVDSVEVVITQEALAAALSAVENHTMTADEALRELVAA